MPRPRAPPPSKRGRAQLQPLPGRRSAAAAQGSGLIEPDVLSLSGLNWEARILINPRARPAEGAAQAKAGVGRGGRGPACPRPLPLPLPLAGGTGDTAVAWPGPLSLGRNWVPAQAHLSWPLQVSPGWPGASPAFHRTAPCPCPCPCPGKSPWTSKGRLLGAETEGVRTAPGAGTEFAPPPDSPPAPDCRSCKGGSLPDLEPLRRRV